MIAAIFIFPLSALSEEIKNTPLNKYSPIFWRNIAGIFFTTGHLAVENCAL